MQPAPFLLCASLLLSSLCPGAENRKDGNANLLALTVLPQNIACLCRGPASHGSFVHQLPLFANLLPFDANTTGIVTTAGLRSFGQVISLVLTTRRSGSRLPIQIMLDSSAPWVDKVCVDTMPRFDATCVFLEDEWAAIVSIIASTFQNVLFLDADCLPVLNPGPIFDQGSEPFTSTGLITFPDFWISTVSPLFYKIAGGLEVPSVSSRSTSESGIIVFDKARHADTLLLAAYYNYNGPSHYYPMFTQHGAGEGDKETFLQAALVLEALRGQGVYKQPTAWMKPGAGVKKGYWDVKMFPSVHGRSEPRGKWRGMFIKQVDPMEDYRAVMAAIEKAKTSPPETKQLAGRAEQEADFLTNSTFLATLGTLKLEHDVSRIMFFHHNGVKHDFTRITDSKSGIVATNAEGEYLRMWEKPDWIIHDFGRDVEKLLWQDSIEIYCQPEMAQFKQLRKVCAKMQTIYEKVYV
ncbi:mannosyltransferase putative-domain-containing protein [Achaetomium macrosporum]|uniref:Mannosyltransferase putative-domain-containing protein n=1 Tax=Achaetomium macrosporum TaxID=79813 RepID=A0AAN7HAY3_9PEZI|nr:mannosyltransferase putative-domain-containing protein [Achaetomium macrosporum]